MLIIYLYGYGAICWRVGNLLEATPSRNWLSFSQKPSTISTSSSRGVHESTPSQCQDPGFDLMNDLCEHPVALCVCEGSGPFLSVLSDLRLLSPFHGGPEPSGEGCLWLCHLWTYRHLFPTLRAGRVSALTTVYRTMKSLWWSLKVALTYGDRMYPEGSLLLHPFREIIVVDSLMGPLNPLPQSWVFG